MCEKVYYVLIHANHVYYFVRLIVIKYINGFIIVVFGGWFVFIFWLFDRLLFVFE